jgi:hypothetical protein
MTDWNIQSRAHVCQACQKPFVDKASYHTILFDQRAELLRMDICQECWQTQYSEGIRERKGFVSCWQGTYEVPAPKPEPIQKENAESLLRKLIELNDPKLIPAGYILAVMLERKRILKVKEQFQRDGQRVFVYEHGKSGDVFTIVDPGLQLNQLEEVQRDVAHLMEHGFEPQPGAPAPDAPANPGDSAADPPAVAASEPAPSTEPPA